MGENEIQKVKYPRTKQKSIKFLKILLSLYFVIGLSFLIFFQTTLIRPGYMSSKKIQEMTIDFPEHKMQYLIDKGIVELDPTLSKRMPFHKKFMTSLDLASIEDLKGILEVYDSGELEKGPIYDVVKSIELSHIYKMCMTYLNFFTILLIIIYFVVPAATMFLDNQIIVIKYNIESAKSKKEQAKSSLTEVNSKISNLEELKKEHLDMSKKVGAKASEEIVAAAQEQCSQYDHHLEMNKILEKKNKYLQLKEMVVNSAIEQTTKSLKEKKDPHLHKKLADDFIKQIAESIKQE